MLHAVELGDPAHPTIVLLHGMGAGHQMWQPQLLPLSEHYYVIAPDLPGCARSISDGPFTLAGAASGVLALLRARGRATAHLCGLSDGAMVALQMYLTDPNRVTSLILSGSPPPYWPPLLRLLPRLLLALPLPWDTFVQRYYLSNLPSSSRETVEAIKDNLQQVGKQGFSDSLKALSTIDLRDHLRQITVPTLVVCGSKDGRGERKAARELSESLPHAELQIIAGAGHVWNLQRPEQFTRLVLSFVQKVEAASVEP
jgi:3-oxoadipate enol-lactonase